MPESAIALASVVALAFIIEAALGFGATLVTVSLGALFLPIRTLLAAFVPVNVVLSTLLVYRNRRHVDRTFLFRRVAPLMLIGLPIGMFAVRTYDPQTMKRVFGVFVALLSIAELAGDLLRGPPKEARQINTPLMIGMLVLGGAVHGAFGTGGPMAVYVVGRKILDKSAFRATLSALWLCLNGLLLAGFIYDGTLNIRSLETSAVLFPSLIIGLVVGEALHHKLPLAVFRKLVFVLLTVVGVAVAVRA